MRTAPTGIITLVITDVQGSTRLWEQGAEVMDRALKRHNQILRRLIEKHAGYEVQTEGDSFLVAFARPMSAVNWCLDVQRALDWEDWGNELLRRPEARAQQGFQGGLRVRMGIHSGEPVSERDPRTKVMKYHGPMVSRSAQISDAAHGGQILMSGEVWELVRAHLARAVGTDLGSHKLKDIPEPVRLFQVMPSELKHRKFPRVRTQEHKKTNLEAGKTSFIGRLDSQNAVATLFDEDARIVTLRGPGGMGKTRLAQQIGHSQVDPLSAEGGGVWFCDLTRASSRSGILSAVASALGVPLTADDDKAVEQVGHAIAGRGRVLVILDNFEQVVAEAAETLSVWVRLAPQAMFLVTSRITLGIEGEVPYDLPPLDEVEALALFEDRARMVRPNFEIQDDNVEVLAEITRRLDGIPLAIELAAARLNVLAPKKLLKMLSKRFQLLAGGARDADARQATLRGAIDWSWELLTEPARDALVQCAVFAGGFTLEAAMEVVELGQQDADTETVIGELYDNSLLRIYESSEYAGEERYGMYESIREYADGKLEGLFRGETERRHETYYLEIGEALIDEVDGPKGPRVLRRIGVERDNYVALHKRAFHRGDKETVVRSALVIDPVLYNRGPIDTHARLLEAALQSDAGGDPAMTARIRLARGVAMRGRGMLDEALKELREGLKAAEAAGDERLRTKCLLNEVALHRARRDYSAAAEALDLAEETAIEAEQGEVEVHRGMLAMSQGRNATAARHLKEALEAYESSPHPKGQAVAHNNYGLLLMNQGNLEGAGEHYECALQLFREAGHSKAVGLALNNIGQIKHAMGDLDGATEAYQAALRIQREMGYRQQQGAVLWNLGRIADEQQNAPEATSLYDLALGHFRSVKDKRFESYVVLYKAYLAHGQGQLKSAIELYRSALKLHRETKDRRPEGYALANLGAALADVGETTEAADALEEAGRLLSSVSDPAGLAVLDLSHGHLDLQRQNPDRALARLKEVHQPRQSGQSAASTSAEVRLAARLLERTLAANNVQSDFVSC